MNHPIAGSVAAGFESVRQQFEAHFEAGLEVGAAVCVLRDGVPVVNLWGGSVDPQGRMPWREDTLVNVYSTTKGPAAIAFATLLDDGAIDYEDPVRRYWPELTAAENGLTVGDLLAHRGGLCGLDETLSVADLYDWSRMIRLLEAQPPHWVPGSQSGYHAVTWGYLPGELIRRIAGETLSRRLRERVCAPTQADFHLGLRAGDSARVAPLVGPNRAKVRREGQQPGGSGPGPLHALALQNPVIRPYQDASSPAWQRAEIAASNGHGTAEGVARVYAGVLSGGLLSRTAIEALVEERVGLEPDLVLGHPIRRGAGVILNTAGMFGPSSQAWGHSGAGGSTGFADPVSGTAFAYVMNQMRDDEGASTRAGRLIEAYYDCL